MAIERYANLCSTNLTASYTAGDGSVTVTSTASPWPASPQFHIFVADQSTGVVKVILKVTAVTDGTHWAVTAEGSDANASSGDVIKLSLTAGAMDQIRADNVALSTFAGKNAARLAGLVQLYSDAPNLARDNGSTFDSFGPLSAFTDPTLVSFAWRNQGSATETQRGQSLYLLAPTLSGNSIKGREIAQPSRPYTITIAFVPHLFQVNFNTCGLYFCDNATGKLVSLILIGTNNGIPAFQINYYTDVNNFSSNPVSATGISASGPTWFQVTDNGTNFIFKWSVNGFDFHQLSSLSRTAFLASPSHVGYFAESNNGSWPSAIQLYSWKQT